MMKCTWWFVSMWILKATPVDQLNPEKNVYISVYDNGEHEKVISCSWTKGKCTFVYVYPNKTEIIIAGCSTPTMKCYLETNTLRQTTNFIVTYQVLEKSHMFEANVTISGIYLGKYLCRVINDHGNFEDSTEIEFIGKESEKENGKSSAYAVNTTIVILFVISVIINILVIPFAIWRCIIDTRSTPAGNDHERQSMIKSDQLERRVSELEEIVQKLKTSQAEAEVGRSMLQQIKEAEEKEWQDRLAAEKKELQQMNNKVKDLENQLQQSKEHCTALQSQLIQNIKETLKIDAVPNKNTDNSDTVSVQHKTALSEPSL